MDIWGRIKKLSIKQLWQLSITFLKRPHYILPTIRATKETMIICDKRFGRDHHLSNQANAFRHALWNFLICQKTRKLTKNNQKSIIWAKKVTVLYEKVTKNAILDEAMDLHNNAIGRKLFLDKKEGKTTEIVAFLTKKMEKAVKIDQIEEINNIENELVYIQ